MNIARPSGGEPNFERTAACNVEEARQLRPRTEIMPDSVRYAKRLPDEIVAEVFGLLSPSDLAACRLADKRFRNIASDAVTQVHLRSSEMLTYLMFTYRRLEKLSFEIDGDGSAHRREGIFSAFWRHTLFNKPRVRELSINGRILKPGSHSALMYQDLSAQDLRYLAHVSTLSSLGLSAVRLGPAAMEQIKDLPDLRSLCMEDVELGNAKLAFLAHFSSLQTLVLEACRVEDDDLVHLCTAPNIRTLHLDENEITDAAIAHIKGLELLESLSLRQTLVEGREFAALKRTKQLRSLGWSKEMPESDGVLTLQHVEPLTSLQHLELGDGSYDNPDDLNRSGLAPLQKLQRLKQLKLNTSDVLDADLAQLASLNTLEEVDLRHSEGFTRAGIESLLAIPSLRKLKLADGDFDLIVAELRSRYPHCTIESEV